MEPLNTPEGRNTALIMGSSIAGLAAARVLSDHFSTVLLVEQDRIENVVEHRRGVPQSRHTHGLLASGGIGLEKLFPGLLGELANVGAVKCCITRDAHWCYGRGEHVRFESAVEGVLVSRPLLEGIVRERVRALPGVKFHEGCRVDGLVATPDKRRVTGIKVEGGILSADLVVDATGRGSSSPQWLDSMGYGTPEQERITVNIGYATRCFRRLPHHLNGALLAAIPATPESRSGGVLLAQEGDRWIATLISYGGQIPTDLPAFIEFAKALPAPYIYNIASQAEPVGEPHSARFPASVRWRYERMRRFPQGFVVIGDAIASTNPAYAFGMSVAILEAIELDTTLRHGSQNLARRFFAQVRKIVDSPWTIVAGNDLRIPGSIGRKAPMSDFMNWYLGQLHISARTDPRLAMAFQKVKNLLAPAQALFRPRLAARVLAGALSRRTAENRAIRLEATERGGI